MTSGRWTISELLSLGPKSKLAGTISNASALREWRLFQANRQAPAAVWQDRIRKLADTLDSIHFSAPPELEA